MEVVVQSPPRSPPLDNFNLNGTMSSPYLSPPSSPKLVGEYYLSAPTSPSRISQLYGEFKYFSTATVDNDSGFHIEAATINDDDDDGFAFFVSHESEKSSRSAEELFDGGKIKPLEPEGTTHDHIIEEGNKVFKASPSKKKKKEAQETEHRRGRDRTPASPSALSSSNSGRRVTRSHSPYRTSQYMWEQQQQKEEEQNPQQQQRQTLSNKEGSSILTSSSSNSSKGSSKRWRFRDLLLFRSASEGRGSAKDPLKSILYNKKHEEITKTSSFRYLDSSSRRKGQASAHEMHYAMKRAESEDMKKRTFLPYKQGILGRLSGFGL